MLQYQPQIPPPDLAETPCLDAIAACRLRLTMSCSKPAPSVKSLLSHPFDLFPSLRGTFLSDRALLRYGARTRCLLLAASQPRAKRRGAVGRMLSLTTGNPAPVPGFLLATQHDTTQPPPTTCPPALRETTECVVFLCSLGMPANTSQCANPKTRIPWNPLPLTKLTAFQPIRECLPRPNCFDSLLMPVTFSQFNRHF